MCFIKSIVIKISETHVYEIGNKSSQSKFSFLITSFLILFGADTQKNIIALKDNYHK